MVDVQLAARRRTGEQERWAQRGPGPNRGRELCPPQGSWAARSCGGGSTDVNGTNGWNSLRFFGPRGPKAQRVGGVLEIKERVDARRAHLLLY